MILVPYPGSVELAGTLGVSHPDVPTLIVTIKRAGETEAKVASDNDVAVRLNYFYKPCSIIAVLECEGLSVYWKRKIIIS